MLFDAQCWPGIVLAKLSAWFRAGMLSARRVGDAVGPASSWRCVRPSIEMATLSAQRRAGDAVGPASSCDGDGNAVLCYDNDAHCCWAMMISHGHGRL